MANIYRYIPLDGNIALSISGYLLVEYSLPKQCEALRFLFCFVLFSLLFLQPDLFVSAQSLKKLEICSQREKFRRNTL